MTITSKHDEFSPTVLAGITAAGLTASDVRRVVRTALAEDLCDGPDATTEATVPDGARAVADLNSRQAGTLAGIPVALAVLDLLLGDRYEVLDQVPDGTRLAPGRSVLVVRGSARGLLTAERTVLNLLCHLSGIATVTARWTTELAGTGCVVRDSRKTLPGLRQLAKYAVRCGGGENHRFSLGDAVLIKDNHVAAAGSVAAALRAVRELGTDLPCEVEVDTVADCAVALAAGATRIMLDNFTPAQCREAVALRTGGGYRACIGASGGLTLDVARDYAETGVDYLAVGGITHSAPALDLGMELTVGVHP